MLCNSHPKCSWLRRSVAVVGDYRIREKPWGHTIFRMVLPRRACYTTQTPPKQLFLFPGSCSPALPPSLAFLDWDQALVLGKIYTHYFAGQSSWEGIKIELLVPRELQGLYKTAPHPGQGGTLKYNEHNRSQFFTKLYNMEETRKWRGLRLW